MCMLHAVGGGGNNVECAGGDCVGGGWRVETVGEETMRVEGGGCQIVSLITFWLL